MANLEELESKARMDFQSVTVTELGNAIQLAMAAGLREGSYTYTSAGETMVWLEEMRKELDAVDEPDAEEAVESFRTRAMSTDSFSVRRTESGFRDRIGSMQALIRMRLSSRRIKKRKVEVQLEAQLLERRADRDVDALQANILDALELGLDDESDVYAEAGMLLNDLSGGGESGFTSASTTPTASPRYRAYEVHCAWISQMIGVNFVQYACVAFFVPEYH